MRSDKEKAYQLRKAGKSYKEIRKDLGVPLSTLSTWFRNLDWSIEKKNELAAQASFVNLTKKQIDLMATANKKRWELWRENFRMEARVEFPLFKRDSLFVSGLMLYWGEGNKSPKAGKVGLSNSDPEMIKIFYLFLKKLGIPKEKIKVWLLLYPDLVDSVQKNFWSKATGLLPEQFKKSIYIKGRHPTKRLSYGVCNIEVYSRGLFEKIMQWLELIKKELI